jgi:hypothetical protein
MDSLKLVLRINAASCIVFGLLGILAPLEVSEFLGNPPVWVLQVTGAVLTMNGLHLILTSLRNTARTLEILYFSMGDLAWWLASVFLIAANNWITTTAGAIVTFCIAFGVAALGVVQLWMIAIQTKRHSNDEHWGAIKRSYWSMPKWVFSWLCLLNIYFLTVVLFWPDRLAVVVLLGYVATGPLLAAQIAFDGGLRRILGLAHLVPWVPLLIWLIMCFSHSLYAIGLIMLLTLCLAFDVFDVWRFWRGDRSSFGLHQQK